MTSFEQYLQKICFTINPEILDDAMPDFFNNWLGNLDSYELMKYAQLFGEEMFVEGRNAALKALEINN